MMKLIKYAVCLLLVSFSLHATIRVGTPLYAPPFVINDGKFSISGFDIQLMQEICQELDWNCEFIGSTGFSLMDKLAKGEVDFVIGDLAITPERQKNFLFSMPYMIIQGGFITLKNTTNISTLTSLQGKRVGVLTGHVYAEYLSKGTSVHINTVPFVSYEDLLSALKNGQIDAAFMSYYTAIYLSNQYPGELKVLDASISFGNGLGIATRYQNKDTMDEINNCIIQNQSNGFFTKMFNYNFLPLKK